MKTIKLITALILVLVTATAQAQQAVQNPRLSKKSLNQSPPSPLTPEERKILDRGEISDGAYISGGVIGTLIGFGIGHAIQGRYSDKGWIFTVSELVLGVVWIGGLLSCFGDSVTGYSTCSSGASAAMAAGSVGLVGIHIWEIVDVWATPPALNEEYHRLKERTNPRRFSMRILPAGRDGFGLGMQFRF